MLCEDVIREFEKKLRSRALSDEYLREQRCDVRADMQIAIEFPYGIIYLRDDAVEILINRIRELENRRGE